MTPAAGRSALAALLAVGLAWALPAGGQQKYRIGFWAGPVNTYAAFEGVVDATQVPDPYAVLNAQFLVDCVVADGSRRRVWAAFPRSLLGARRVWSAVIPLPPPCRAFQGLVSYHAEIPSPGRGDGPSPDAVLGPTALRPGAVDVTRPLPAPQLLHPQQGAVFDHLPRRLILTWRPVPGASWYSVEIQYLVGGEWRHQQTATTGEPAFDFHFPGPYAGAWAVWAHGPHGRPGARSEFGRFSFSR